MNWLVRLKQMESASTTHLQKLQNVEHGVSVVFVGAWPEPFQKSRCNEIALMDGLLHLAKDDAALADTFTARVALFTDRGLSLDDAQALANKMEKRDQELDDRRLCLECLHLSGGPAARRCRQWQMRNIGSPAVPVDVVAILQRCEGFGQRLRETV